MELLKIIVILKNLPSNLVEEAIVVFKENKKVKKYQYIDAEKGMEENKIKNTNNIYLEEEKNKYIVKEAEMVISNYLSKIEKEKEHKSYSIRQIETRYKRMKAITIVLSLIVVIDVILTII